MKLDILLLIVKIEEEQNHSLKNRTRDKIIRSVINGRITYTEGCVQNSTLNFDSLIYFHNYNVCLQKLQGRIPRRYTNLNISRIVLHISANIYMTKIKKSSFQYCTRDILYMDHNCIATSQKLTSWRLLWRLSFRTNCQIEMVTEIIIVLQHRMK